MSLRARHLPCAGTSYQARPPALYCGGNNLEKEVIQCLIVILAGVPGTGFPTFTESAPSIQATTMRKAGLPLRHPAFLFWACENSYRKWPRPVRPQRSEDGQL